MKKNLFVVSTIIGILVVGFFTFSYRGGIVHADLTPTLGTGNVMVTIPPGFTGVGYVTVSVSGQDVYNATNSPSGSAQVTINPAPVTPVTPVTHVPIVSLSASPTTGASPLSTTLTWSLSGGAATSCTAGGGWSGSKSTSGSTESITGIATSTTYTLQCSNAGGNSNTASATVSPTGPSTPVCTLTTAWLSGGGTYNVGDTVNYTWSSTCADGGSSSWIDSDGNSGLWSASCNSFSSCDLGSTSGVIGLSQAGLTYTITYTAKNSVSGKSASRSITVVVNGNTNNTNNTNNTSCSGNAPSCTSSTNNCNMSNSGSEICTNGVWGGCNAIAPSNSLCSSINIDPCGSDENLTYPNSPGDDLCADGSSPTVYTGGSGNNTYYYWYCGNYQCSTWSGDGNASKCLSVSAPSTVTPGQTFSATVSMKNIGTEYWNSFDNNPIQPYRLGSQDPQDNTTWGLGRVELPQFQVNPDETADFVFTATAPSVLGVYPFNWKMVQENVEWFGDTCAQNIVVAPACSANADCNDNNPATVDTCDNPGKANSYCTNILSQYSITVTKTIGGSVTSSPSGISCGTTCVASYNSGTQVTMTQVPDSQYWKFEGWAGDCTGTGSCVLNMTANHAVSAKFEPVPFKYGEF